jgi:hypothetical protein
MKTALLIPGQARFCAEFDTQLSNLQNSEIDWYVAFWKLRDDHQRHRTAVPQLIDYQYRDWLIPPGYTAETEQQARDYIEPYLPPKHRLVDVKLFDYLECPPLPRTYNGPRVRCNPEVLFQQYWMVHQADLLRQQSGIEYDLMIRSRPDLGLRAHIDLEHVYKILKQNPSVILTSSNRRGNLIDDMFAVGLPEAIGRYCNMVNHFDHVYINYPQVELATETFIAFTLRYLGLEYPMTNINTTYRTIGTGADRLEINAKFQPDFGRWA